MTDKKPNNRGSTKKVVNKKPTEPKQPKGKPRSFKTEDDFKNKFIEYLTSCEERKRFPNIAGFCAYCWITRDTFYMQKEYYSDTYNKVRDMLEDEVLQDNSYRMQLYLKNTFGYTDKQVVESTNVNLNHEMTEEEADEILKKANISV